MTTAAGTDDFGSVRDLFIAGLLAGRPPGRGAVPEPPADPALLQPLAQAAAVVGPRVTALVVHVLPVLLRSLSRVNEPVRQEQREHLRGRIDWAATYKQRLAEHNDRALFVTREVRRQYDTPENELLVFVLAALDRLITGVPDQLRAGAYWSPGGPERPAPVDAALARHGGLLREYRRHIHLREVPIPALIGSRHVLKARTSKTEWYAAVADAYALLDAVTGPAAPAALAPALRECIVLPGGVSGAGREWVRWAAWAMRDH
jgi:hypothetical protein